MRHTVPGFSYRRWLSASASTVTHSTTLRYKTCGHNNDSHASISRRRTTAGVYCTTQPPGQSQRSPRAISDDQSVTTVLSLTQETAADLHSVGRSPLTLTMTIGGGKRQDTIKDMSVYQCMAFPLVAMSAISFITHLKSIYTQL